MSSGCVTWKLCPAMVTVQARLLPVLFAVAVTVTEPFPVPLVGDTVSHVVHGLLTLQLQPAPPVTVTIWLPPLAEGLQLVGLIVNVPLPVA